MINQIEIIFLYLKLRLCNNTVADPEICPTAGGGADNSRNFRHGVAVISFFFFLSSFNRGKGADPWPPPPGSATAISDLLTG